MGSKNGTKSYQSGIVLIEFSRRASEWVLVIKCLAYFLKTGYWLGLGSESEHLGK